MDVRSVLLSAVGIVVLSTAAAAQESKTPSAYNLTIPAEPLADALNDLAQQSGLQILFSSDLVARLRSAPLKGSVTADEAMRHLLANTGLRFEFVNPHTIAIFAASGSPPGAQSDHSGDNAMQRSGLLARLLGVFAVCGSAMSGGNACAETPAVSAAPETPALQDIIVTARKHHRIHLCRAPSLQYSVLHRLRDESSEYFVHLWLRA
jgi:Secretin and TonB N terminus short domain